MGVALGIIWRKSLRDKWRRRQISSGNSGVGTKRLRCYLIRAMRHLPDISFKFERSTDRGLFISTCDRILLRHMPFKDLRHFAIQATALQVSAYTFAWRLPQHGVKVTTTKAANFACKPHPSCGGSFSAHTKIIGGHKAKCCPQ